MGRLRHTNITLKGQGIQAQSNWLIGMSCLIYGTACECIITNDSV